MKKKICSLFFCLFCCVGAYAQITTANYSQYIGQEIIFDTGKPWYQGYAIGSYVFSNYRIKNGVVIKDIQLVNQGTILEFTLLDKSTGKETKFREWIDDEKGIKLSYVSVSANPISEKKKIEAVLHLDDEKTIDQKISNHISTHGFNAEDKYLQSLVERKRSLMEEKEIESSENVERKTEKVTEGISQGDNLFYLMLGGGFSSGKVEGVKWGEDGGLSYGIQVLSFLTPEFGMGFEFNGTNFAEISESGNYYYSGSFYNVKESLKVNTNNIMLTARLNMNPKDDVRVYIPFGMGLGITSLSYDLRVGGYGGKEKDRSTDFAWFLGLGLEGKIEENTFFAIETRFNQLNFDFEELELNSRAKYINILAKIGWKF